MTFHSMHVPIWIAVGCNDPPDPATVGTINARRANVGLGSIEDGELTIVQYLAKHVPPHPAFLRQIREDLTKRTRPFELDTTANSSAPAEADDDALRARWSK